jgi:hypothetical protein
LLLVSGLLVGVTQRIVVREDRVGARAQPVKAGRLDVVLEYEVRDGCDDFGPRREHELIRRRPALLPDELRANARRSNSRRDRRVAQGPLPPLRKTEVRKPGERVCSISSSKRVAVGQWGKNNAMITFLVVSAASQGVIAFQGSLPWAERPRGGFLVSRGSSKR